MEVAVTVEIPACDPDHLFSYEVNRSVVSVKSKRSTKLHKSTLIDLGVSSCIFVDRLFFSARTKELIILSKSA